MTVGTHNDEVGGQLVGLLQQLLHDRSLDNKAVGVDALASKLLTKGVLLLEMVNGILGYLIANMLRPSLIAHKVGFRRLDVKQMERCPVRQGHVPGNFHQTFGDV
jgi:hypothetical protein